MRCSGSWSIGRLSTDARRASKIAWGASPEAFYLLLQPVEMQKNVFDKYRLAELDAHFTRNCDARSYMELLAEMRAAEIYTGKPYRILQKRAGRMWAAAQEYRAEQKLARTHVGEVAAQRASQLRAFCPMCNELRVPQDDEGHCSYSCASGGGWRVAPDLSGNEGQ